MSKRIGAAASNEFTENNAKQAVLAFNGDVYQGFDAASLTYADLKYAQNHVRVLSGLYGLLGSLDLMQPYRLEMGTRLVNARGKDLYAFWGDTVTDALNALIKRSRGARALINCASAEYFKAVRAARFEMPVITPVFEDWKAGRYRVIGFHAKRARGLLARYAVVHRVSTPERLQAFGSEGYAFDASASDDARYVFRRRLGGSSRRRLP